MNGGCSDSDCTITSGKAELFWKVMAQRKGLHRCSGGFTSRLTNSPIRHAVPIWAQQKSGIGQAVMSLAQVRPLASLDATRHGRKTETQTRLICLIVDWVSTARGGRPAWE